MRHRDLAVPTAAAGRERSSRFSTYRDGGLERFRRRVGVVVSDALADTSIWVPRDQFGALTVLIDLITPDQNGVKLSARPTSLSPPSGLGVGSFSEECPQWL
jgi:hypothetical protein